MVDTGRRRRTSLLVAGAVVAVAAIVAAVLVIVLRRDDPDDPDGPVVGTRTLSLPRNLDGYLSTSSGDPDRFAATVRNYLKPLAGDAGSGVLRHGALGNYRDDGAILTVIGVALRDAPGVVARVAESGLDATVQRFLVLGLGTLGAKGRPTAYAAGPLGGVMRCTRANAPGVDSAACAWGDSSTFGLMIYLIEPDTVAEAAARTRSLRALIERG